MIKLLNILNEIEIEDPNFKYPPLVPENLDDIETEYDTESFTLSGTLYDYDKGIDLFYVYNLYGEWGITTYEDIGDDSGDKFKTFKINDIILSIMLTSPDMLELAIDRGYLVDRGGYFIDSETLSEEDQIKFQNYYGDLYFDFAHNKL